MTRKTLLSVAVALFVLQAAQANAKEGLFGAGARFTWDNYKTPVVVHTSSGTTSNIDVNSYGGPSFAGEFHLIPIDRLVISLGLDFGLFKHTVYPFVEGGNEQSSTATYFTFGFLLGVKFYIIEPKPQKATLFVHLAGGKYITKLKNDLSEDDTFADDNKALQVQLDAIGDLGAPAVIQVALGAEYHVTSAFSVGADILGLRISFASYNTGPLAADEAANYPEAVPFSGEGKYLSVGLYSAVLMNFGFAGGGKDRDEEDEEGWGGEASGGEGWRGGGAAAGGGEAAPAGGEAPAGGDGWGAPAGGDADGGDSWGAPADGDAGGGGDGWGAAPAPAPEPAPEPAPAPSDGGGWGASPPPTPPSGGGGGGRPKPKKAKPKPKSSAPPPPPPGY